MPKLRDHQSNTTTKLLFIGHTGSGKTGALASLACAGYNLRVMDLDNGSDIIKHLLLDKRSPYYSEEAADRVEIETITDKMKPLGGKLVPVNVSVWDRAIKMLADWPGLGPVTTWSPKDILVIDSLSRLSDAAMTFQLSSAGRLGGRVEQSDWYFAQGIVESFLRTLFDTSITCNVIILCHIAFIGDEGMPMKGYPQTLGKALPPKVGQFFNSMVQAETVGFGSSMKKIIRTKPSALIELKTSIPLAVPDQYPLEHGLASFFKDIRGGQQPLPWEYKGPIPLGLAAAARAPLPPVIPGVKS